MPRYKVEMFREAIATGVVHVNAPDSLAAREKALKADRDGKVNYDTDDSCLMIDGWVGVGDMVLP